MCKDCFESEISSFESEESFISFETKFTNKLLSNKLVKLKTKTGVKEGFREDGPYQCSSCNTKWIVSSPDYSWRGYLISNSIVGKTINVKTKQVIYGGGKTRGGIWCSSKIKIDSDNLLIFRNSFSFYFIFEPLKLPITIPSSILHFNKYKVDVSGHLILGGLKSEPGFEKKREFEIAVAPDNNFTNWEFYRESILKFLQSKSSIAI
jgi:hypothetical protein